MRKRAASDLSGDEILLEKTARLSIQPRVIKNDVFRLGADFETTFFSVAIVKPGETFKAIHFVGDWPDRLSRQMSTAAAYLKPLPKDGSVPQKKKPGPEDPQKYLTGWKVETLVTASEFSPKRAQYPNNRIVKKVKLLLEKATHLKRARKNLGTVIEQLWADKHIETYEDVIRDILASFFIHTKKVLMRDHGLKNNSRIELAICTPVCWSPESQMIMSTCAEKALKVAELRNVRQEGGRIHGERGRSRSSASLEDVHHGLSFVILDCGGGTTDVGTYKVALPEPLRLEIEVVPPNGAMCGSSNLNELLSATALDDLKNETYLEIPRSGVTLQSTIDRDIVQVFEDRVKRSFDWVNCDEPIEFRPGRSEGDLPTISKIIGDLMVGQIEKTQEVQIQVSKVVLVGGFGDSPTLKWYIRKTLDEYNNKHGTNIQLSVAPQNEGVIGVAAGSAIRLCDRSNGPARTPRMSIGIQRSIAQEDQTDPDVQSQTAVANEFNRVKYIRNTLEWVVKKGQGELQPIHTASFDSEHVFSEGGDTWKAKETLYYSWECTEDHFHTGHAKNKNKAFKLVGEVVFDLSELQDGIMEIQPDPVAGGNSFFNVKLRIKMTVIDRHLNFVATYKGKQIKGSKKTFGVAAGFELGTE